MTEHSLLILSDSHGHTRNLREALARQLRAPDIILFLGDGLRDLGCLGLNEKKSACWLSRATATVSVTPSRMIPMSVC